MKQPRGEETANEAGVEGVSRAWAGRGGGRGWSVVEGVVLGDAGAVPLASPVGPRLVLGVWRGGGEKGRGEKKGD